MAGTLELKSTFYFNAERLGLGLSDTRFFQPKSSLTTLESKKAVTVPKMNSLDVASDISKVIFEGLGMDLKKSTESNCIKRLTTLINKHFDQDSHILSLNSFGHKVEGFDFKPTHSFDENVKAKFCIKEGAHKGHMILHIPAFVPTEDLNVCDSVSNFKIFARLIAVSDFEKMKDGYGEIKPDSHGSIGVFQTPMLPLLKISTQPFTSQVSIQPPTYLEQGISTVMAIGFKFYSYKDKKFNRLEEETMMKVFKVC